MDVAKWLPVTANKAEPYVFAVHTWQQNRRILRHAQKSNKVLWSNVVVKKFPVKHGLSEIGSLLELAVFLTCKKCLG